MPARAIAWLLFVIPAFAGGDGVRFHPGGGVTAPLENDSSWREIDAPHRWPDPQLASGWYRCHVTVRPELRGQPLGLYLGVVASEDEVFLNGSRIGGSGTFGSHGIELPENFPRLYPLPEKSIRWDGPNVIDIRVIRNFRGPAGLLTAAPEIGHLHELSHRVRVLRFPFRLAEALLLGGIGFSAILMLFVLCHRYDDGVCPLFLLVSLFLAGGIIAESQFFHESGFRNATTVKLGWASFNLATPITLMFLSRFLERPPGRFLRFILWSGVVLAFAPLLLPDLGLIAIAYFGCQLAMFVLVATFTVRGLFAGTPGVLPLSLGLAGCAVLSTLAMLEIGGLLPGFIPAIAQRSIPAFQGAVFLLLHGLLFAIAARFAHSAKTARELMHRALGVQDAERRRISRELHDGIGQDLQALRMRVHLADSQGRDAPQIESSISALINDVRKVSHDLYPGILGVLPVGTAIKEHLDEMRDIVPFAIECDIGFTRPLPDTFQAHLFRIVQEAMRNAIRHSSATTFSVSLRDVRGLFARPCVELEIRDDGTGFDPALAGSGLGLLTIRERAEALGGTATIRSRPGDGTCINVRIPVLPAPPADEKP